MLTVDVAEGQLPFDTVHTKELVPVANAVTCEDGLLTEVIVPEPESNDQKPVPIAGLFADKVVIVLQSV